MAVQTKKALKRSRAQLTYVLAGGTGERPRQVTVVAAQVCEVCGLASPEWYVRDGRVYCREHF